MKSYGQDKAESKFHEVNGRLRKVIGKLSDNPELKAEDTVKKIYGQVQENISQIGGSSKNADVWGDSYRRFFSA
jgi:uncharacterized protein YjbJ (UPF0337 family)